MSVYWDRVIDIALASRLLTFGGVVVQGPRAVGKTRTGLNHAQSSARLDASPDYLALANVSPSTVLQGQVPRLIDEWQLAPSIWNSVRYAIDERGEPGQFILTGSATPEDVSTHHSGAGRIARLTMRPMSLAESRESTQSVSVSQLFSGESVAGIGGLDVAQYAQAIVRGGWPSLVIQTHRSASDYLLSYLDDIARVDLSEVGLEVDPIRMSALIRALARNVASEVAATKLSAEAEISAQAARKYLDALTRVFVLEEQPAWAPHLRSKIRLRVQPKWHFIDPSLAAAAMGATPDRLLADMNSFGFLFESLCVRDLRVYAETLGGSVYHYRDSSGLEVDAIVELRDGCWAAFEVKMGGEDAVEQAAHSLKNLKSKVSEEKADQLRSLTVLTAGAASYTRGDGVNVVALGHLHAGVYTEH